MAERRAARVETSDEEDSNENEPKTKPGNKMKSTKPGPKGADKSVFKEWLKKLETSAVLEHKADLKDLIKLGELKTNKFDTDILLKCVEVQH